MCFSWLSDGKKGWLVCDLQTGNMFVSRDVVFHEHIYPYATPVLTDDQSLDAPSSSSTAMYDEWETTPNRAEISATGGDSSSPLPDGLEVVSPVRALDQTEDVTDITSPAVSSETGEVRNQILTKRRLFLLKLLKQSC